MKFSIENHEDMEKLPHNKALRAAWNTLQH